MLNTNMTELRRYVAATAMTTHRPFISVNWYNNSEEQHTKEGILFRTAGIKVKLKQHGSALI